MLCTSYPSPFRELEKNDEHETNYQTKYFYNIKHLHRFFTDSLSSFVNPVSTELLRFSMFESTPKCRPLPRQAEPSFQLFFAFVHFFYAVCTESNFTRTPWTIKNKYRNSHSKPNVYKRLATLPRKAPYDSWLNWQVISHICNVNIIINCNRCQEFFQ